jgi:hypothetical protein
MSKKYFHKPCSVFWAHLGQSHHPACQHQMLGFVVPLGIQNLLCCARVELLSIWACKNISHIQVELFTFFFQPHPHKIKTGIFMRWETTNNNLDYVANEQEELGLIIGKK